MTISSETRKAGPFTGNGVTTAFPFAFKVFAAADVAVTLTVLATGVQSTLALTTDYTIALNADQNANPGGTVTYNPSGVPMPSTKTLTISSVVGNTQGYEPTNGGAWLPTNAENAWDRAVILIQQVIEKVTRSIKFPIVDGSLTSTLPTAALRANKAIVFDASGNVDVSADDYVNQAANAAASASDAATSALLAEDWASKTSAIVAATDYSAKEFAQGTQASTGGSAKSWAQQTGADVTGAAANSRSAKSWAQDDLHGATLGGSAKDWAQSASLPDGTNKSAKSYAADAATSATASATSATASAGSATAAAASAVTAQAAASAQMWRDVVFKTFADSPITIATTDRGKFFSIDCTGGAVIVNLPAIAGLDLSVAWAIGIKKEDSSGNSITVNRASTDTIDGSTSKTIGVAGSGTTLIPDTDPAPDMWTAADFGATAGNMTVDVFNGDGSTVAFTLSVSPGSKNNMQVVVGGVPQYKSTYSLSGTTLTFSAAPPSGTANIEVTSGTTLSIGTPADSTVTGAKLADSVVNDLTTVTAASGDYVAIADVSDSSKKKKALVSDILTLANVAYIYVRDAKASGTEGGGFTSGSWTKRDLNTEVNDDGNFCSLASNQVTLLAGTYRFQGRAPAYHVEGHQVKLVNVTDTIEYVGSSAYADVTGTNVTDSCVRGRFTIASTKVFELQHKCITTRATNGLGKAGSLGVSEVYAELEFWREK